ncbi:MAG: WYL domain-containing protein, partial [Venatoribacter sp.]
GSSYTAPAPEHTRPIIHAITHQQRLDIRYASIKNPDGEERIISPHSLINNGQRWHVRAWCEKSEGYRDFVLSRIRQVFNLEGQAQMSAEQDEQWNAWINFSIEPDPRFNEAQKALIALDYGMSKNSQGKYQKHYQVRKALVLYWVQHLRIDRYREAPEAQQIILSPESNQIVKDCLPR